MRTTFTGEWPTNISHVDDDDVGRDLRPNGFHHPTEVRHEPVGYHELGDDVRAEGVEEPHAGVVAPDAEHLPSWGG